MSFCSLLLIVVSCISGNCVLSLDDVSQNITEALNPNAIVDNLIGRVISKLVTYKQDVKAMSDIDDVDEVTHSPKVFILFQAQNGHLSSLASMRRIGDVRIVRVTGKTIINIPITFDKLEIFYERCSIRKRFVTYYTTGNFSAICSYNRFEVEMTVDHDDVFCSAFGIKVKLQELKDIEIRTPFSTLWEVTRIQSFFYFHYLTDIVDQQVVKDLESAFTDHKNEICSFLT